ncbi:ferredoxin [Profundibacter sp.]|uniref:ferredoxin n=1 Tax=Profundibacter sp. TaxID=3101071 RepID=UPI003D0B6C13
MSYTELQSSLQEQHLDIFGAFHPTPQDQAPEGCKTLLLIGPYKPGFWGTFKASPEFSDGLPDPLDRWSKRIITPWATARNSTALFPSNGPPYAPFLDWAQSGRAWVSPVGMLVHDLAGLFISYRAAIALPVKITLPHTGPNTCDSCDARPCLAACPVDALSDTYDVSTCEAYLNTPNGRDCMETGCLVRRTCPAGHNYARLPEQSAFHMAAFNP